MAEGQNATTQENINLKEWKGFQDFMLRLRTAPRPSTYRTPIFEALRDENYPPDLLHKGNRGPKAGPPRINGRIVAEYLPEETGHSTFIVRDASEFKVPLFQNNWETIHDSFLQVGLNYITPFDLLRKLFDFTHSEATVRRLINEILNPIMKQNGLIYHDNPPVPGDGAGSRRPDYLIQDENNGKVHGVIEAKAAGRLVRESITQCMQYLLDLHAEERSTRESRPLFGVVTDSLHFIFIKLHSDGQFAFEEDNLGQIKVHTANTWADLNEIAATINGLCQLRKRYSGLSQMHTIGNIGQLFLKKNLEDTSPFGWATDTPVLNFL